MDDCDDVICDYIFRSIDMETYNKIIELHCNVCNYTVHTAYCIKKPFINPNRYPPAMISKCPGRAATITCRIRTTTRIIAPNAPYSSICWVKPSRSPNKVITVTRSE